MAIVESSELVTYNANNRGTNTGDCTARAISLAFNMEYRQARQALNQSVRDNWRMDWSYNSHENVKKVIKNLGGGSINDISEVVPAMTVNDWVDKHNSGTYIIWCSSIPNKRKNLHLVTAINGKLYDSWDCRNYYVLGYWTITSGITGDDISDIGEYVTNFFKSRDLDGYIEYFNSVFDTLINKNRKLKKLADQYHVDIDIDLHLDRIQYTGYTIKFTYTITFGIPAYNVSNQQYTSKFGITFKPTMKVDEVEPFFDNTFASKFSSSIYTVVNTIEDICEGYELTSDTETSSELSDGLGMWFYSNREKKSFNSLPYWVKKLATHFSADFSPWAEFSDRIRLTMKMPKFDIEYVPGEYHERRYFHAYTMDDLKRGLEEYKKTGDYERAYQIAGDY